MKEVIKLKKDGSIEFETIKSHKNRLYFLCGFVCVVVLLVVFVVTRSHAKYRVTQSIPLVNGTINYSLPDLNIVGLYIDGEEATELDSSKKYTLDTTQSTCTYKDGSTIPNLTISYDSETGALQISPFTTKGTKCTLYFNEQVFASDTILAGKTISTRSSFSSTLTTNTTGTIYQAEDDDGITYYFAGNPSDNWVRWAGFYWRIIRINGDGTIRLIYQGTSANTTGSGTQISTSAFNSSYNNNAYVGFKYTSGNEHGTGTNSTILGVLNTWYSNNLSSYADDIDGNAGFCNDRTPYSGSGTGTTATDYVAYNRLYTNKSPSFKCTNSSDLFTVSSASKGNRALQYPIGLITADEVAYAGGVYGRSNSSYYLYTGEYYWTMSPNRFSSSIARVFYVYSNGDLTNFYAYSAYGVRPVINLKADIQITGGNGTSTNPYVIN